MHKLDRVDLFIINSLMKDGRKSFRQIAKETGVSTPTVEARFSRMKSMGVIKNIEPIIDVGVIENQISTMVFLRADLSRSVQIANELAAIPEVKQLYMITGENNMMVKVISKRPEKLEQLVREKIASIQGISSVSYQIITRTFKDSQSVSIGEEMFLKLKCDFCDADITKKPRKLQVDEQQRYFCCNSCLILYRQKYKRRIDALNKRR